MNGLKNHLNIQDSPYLLQHAQNPVHWYPWCDEAFAAAKEQNKPIFLSIGYSTCHWCHVMAHESFEDEQIAAILNEHFICIKVDKEERPDVDHVYMEVCQAMTGSGGWPMSIFMIPDQAPFFAGTYFPKNRKNGMIGFEQLITTIAEQWEQDHETFTASAQDVVRQLAKSEELPKTSQQDLIGTALSLYQRSFDPVYGGFGSAPKFPAGHNLLFLMEQYTRTKDADSLHLVEKTLQMMFRGGLYDHIGGGFSRYSTDRRFLVPHFEKMLYDNALLLMCYTMAYQITNNALYRNIVYDTVEYIKREMTAPNGGFYAAQDADSQGGEGEYYVFGYGELLNVLGEETGKRFNEYYGVTKQGNFEGKNILNLLANPRGCPGFEVERKRLYEYRKGRMQLHLDDKILTAWNGLMIGALAMAYRIFQDKTFLALAVNAQKNMEERLMYGDTLSISYRNRAAGKGLLDDYANTIFGLTNLYEATLEPRYLDRAMTLCQKTIHDFYDKQRHGFYLSGRENERLILSLKPVYDGAMPSGNSMMAYNLFKLKKLTGCTEFDQVIEEQFAFLETHAARYPIGHSFFLKAKLEYEEPLCDVVCVLKRPEDRFALQGNLGIGVNLLILEGPTQQYPLLENKTTYYVCKGHACFPPVNSLDAFNKIV